MYEIPSQEDLFYYILYGGGAMMAMIASCYLLFRKGNAFAHDITTPIRLRKCTAALFAAIALGHIWYMPLAFLSPNDDAQQVYLVGGLLDCMTIFPLAIAVLLAMLQNRRRPLWFAGVVVAPLVAGMAWCVACHSDVLGPFLYGYLLLLGIGLTIYMVRALIQYGHWLRDNYADLEHKEVWHTFLVLAAFTIFFGIYVSGLGGPAYKYILRLNIMVMIGYLLWRVETLTDLSIAPSPSTSTSMFDETTAVKYLESNNLPETTHDDIGPLLQKYCIDTQLYLQHDLTLLQLAQAIGTNRNYLSQYFSHQGLNYNTYINDLRINHFLCRYHDVVEAQQPFTVQQLAHDSGYRSYSTFSLAFKQRIGKSVTAWMRTTTKGGSLKYVLLIISISLCSQAMAQQAIVSLIKKVGTKMDSMAVKGVDRRYIEAPEKPWQLIVRGNVSQTLVSMSTQGNMAGEEYHAKPTLKTVPSQYIGVWAGYRGYGLGYTVNIGGDKGSYLTFGATGGSYGINVRIHSFENHSPNFHLNSDIIPEESKDDWNAVHLTDPIHIRTVIADGYYLFNGKKFSYAAAYDQSVIQKLSVGSLMAGLMYNYTHINYSSDLNGDLIYLMEGLGRIKLWQGSLGVGYAYNWVPTRGLLINIMAMPMLTLVNKLKAYGYATNVEELMADPYCWDPTVTNEEWDKWFYGNLHITPMGNKTFDSGISLGFDARMSLTYNFGRFFLNAYGQFNNIRYHHNNTHGYLNDWFVNTSLGIRL